MSRSWGQGAEQAPGVDGAGDRPPSAEYALDQLRRGRVFVVLALMVMAGVVLGAWQPRGGLWLAVALGPMAAMGAMLWRAHRADDAGARRAAMCWGLVAVVMLMAGWTALRTTHVSEHHITRYLSDERQLAKVTGTVVNQPFLATPKRGELGRFSYMPPATLFRLSLDSIVWRGERVPVSGKVLGRINVADHRLRPGQRIEATGWLTPIDGPDNPGEVDHRARLAEQGVFGRLTLSVRGNWSPYEGAADEAEAARWRRAFIALRATLAWEARRSLHLGMLSASDHQTQAEQRRRLALLDALLLGQRRGETRELYEAFRTVGLAHLMAISGAHLGILMGLVWLAVRLVTPRPAWAAWLALGVLMAYLMIVPLRVPIVRAAIMAGLLCIGYGRGRGVSATGMLALAAIVVLLWRPGDLFNPGFQLSFSIVAALLLFTRPLADRMWPRESDEAVHHELGLRRVARRLMEFVAVSVIAFMVALPVVAHHFEMVNPLSVLMSVLALPVVTLLLGLGYLKILLGLLWPSASILLAGPMAWVTDAMLVLVEQAGRWPGMAIELMHSPPMAWVVGMLMVVAALLWGCFAHRRGALALCVIVLASWTFAIQRPDTLATLIPRPASEPEPAPTLRVNMFAVGHGSAYLIRVGEHVLMYDCGAQPYLDVGERRILPALRRLDVRRIDTLFISHAHLDHYSGVLALVDAMPVGEIRAPPQFFDVARDVPRGSAAYLIDALKQRGLAITPTVRGWSRRLDHARVDALWPPAEYTTLQPNDTSLVLLIESAEHRLLMTGDMEQDAIDGLIARGQDTRADVAELPHHGGWVDSSPDWLEAVQPRLVLQSSTRPRARRDLWTDILAEHGVKRLTTFESGMVEVTMQPGEPIRWRAFRDETNQAHELAPAEPTR